MGKPSKWVKTFVADKRGNIAIMFGAIIFAIIAASGAAIDFLRIDRARTALAEAGDAALIAAARYKGTHPTATDAQITDVARKLFASEVEKEQDIRIYDFDIVFNDAAQSFRLSIDADLDLLLLDVFGMKLHELDTTAEAKLGKPPYIELAMALDVTGSMNSNGKLSALKSASKDLVESLLNYETANAKIGIVPFAQYVNVGNDHGGAAWLENPGGAWKGCVGSRPYPWNIRDDGFSAVKAPGLNGASCPKALLPLTDNEDDLIEMIDELTASGWTYIAPGVGWAWSLLTPEQPFTEAIRFEDVKDVNGVKALMVMTDGENTRAPDYPTHGSADKSLANSITTEICENVKAQDIVIYSVAFDVSDATIKDILRGCATNSSYYFDAKDSEALSEAFASIAASLRNISLSK